MDGLNRVTGTDAVAEDVLVARAYLSRVAEAASLPVWRFVRDVGPVEAADAIARGKAPSHVLKVTSARASDADARSDLEVAAGLGIDLVVPESPLWPQYAFLVLEHAAAERLDRYDLGDRKQSDSGELIPPLALWVKGAAVGELPGLGVRSVGLVGARAASSYGEHVATDFAYGLATRGVAIVSGGAYGIDAAAHRGALAGGGLTVLVSAGGLDRPYPTGNMKLFERVAETGLLLSESPPGANPMRYRFLSRNRLIAALSAGTVIVQAARRSGAINTATHCAKLGRPLMAVPGPVTSTLSSGCHELLRRDADPALLVCTADDVLAVVGSAGEGLTLSEAPATGDVRDELDHLDFTTRRVFEGLPARRYVRPDELAARCGVPVVEVIRALPVLELHRLAESKDAGYRVAARLRRTATRD